MVGTRDQPRDIEDAPDYSRGMAALKHDGMMKSVQQMGMDDDDDLSIDYARTLARQCYDSSTNWLNAGRRIKWNNSLRAFQGLHSAESKYLSTDYRYRSRLFRPKTRTMVRKAEAETAAAFFANEDVVNVQAQDDDNPLQRASADINKALLQYRLTRTIPWFLTLVGARQDAEVMGICVAKAYWKYKEVHDRTEQRPKMDPDTGQAMLDPETGEPMNDTFDIFNRAEDHPWVDLVAPENFRFDPGADWRNPVATSPYVIELIPMYLCDIREKIRKKEWFPISDSSLRSSTDLDDDVTRRAREQGRVPGKDHDSWKPSEYDICWVRANIVRVGAQDWHFYTLASAGELLSKPMKIEDVYLHGIRPYVVGFVIPEAHKTYPTSKVELVRDLQAQTNEVTNLRLDNVKLAINPRQFVKDGKGIDPNDVRNFQPGKVVMVRDPKEDIQWDRPPDVTQSSFEEQDRLNIDFDDLTGNMSNSSVQGNKQVYEAVGNMQMMAGQASMVGEYEQRVFAETFVEPLVGHLIKLEQAYETDPTILAIAGREAQLFQKFGVNDITDELLQQELTTKVNVGIGATNPQVRLKNFVTATQVIGEIYGPAASMATNPQEIIKEVFSLCGYRDGDRFFDEGANITQMMQQMAAQKGQKGQGAGNDPQKLAATQATAQAKLQERKLQSDTDLKIAMLDFQKEKMKEEAEDKRDQRQTQQDLIMAHQDRQFQHGQKQMDRQHQMVQGAVQHQRQQQSAMQHPALGHAGGQAHQRPGGFGHGFGGQQAHAERASSEPQDNHVYYDESGNRVSGR